MTTFRYLAALLGFIASVLLLSGCGSHRGVTASKSPAYRSATVTRPAKGQIAVAQDLPEETKALLREADKWLGTAYRYGGNTREGVDCSGLVCNLFNTALSIKLPRNSAQQSAYCSGINRSDLIIGDLLFFTTSRKGGISHVGMYIGDGKMVHSSTSRGVIVSSLEESYYKRTYHSSGRVDRYYAMLPKGKKRRYETEPTPIALPETPPQTVKPESFEDLLLADVRSAMGSKLQEEAKAAAKETLEQVSGKLVAAAPGETTRAALERTRRKVLDEVIDQKVDSIVSDFFD